MSTLNRKFLFVLIMLIVLGGLFAWVFSGRPIQSSPQSSVTQTTSSTPLTQVTSTQGIKTYRNAEFGFEFKYPDNWEIRVNTFKSPFSKFNLVAHPTNTHSNFEPFGINITDADYVERSYQGLESKATSTTVDGVIATKYEYVAEAYNIDVIVPIGGNRILIGNENKEHLPEFNQILASFKFLK